MARYTEEEQAAIRREYRRRQAYEVPIMIPLIGGVLLIGMPLRNAGYHIGSWSGAQLMLAGALAAGLGLVLHLRNWRCPGCGVRLKGGLSRGACTACGAVFTEVSRREAARAEQAGAAVQQVAAEKALKREIANFKVRGWPLARTAAAVLLGGIALLVAAYVQMDDRAPAPQILALTGGGVALLALGCWCMYRLRYRAKVLLPRYEAQLRDKLGLPPAAGR